MKRFLSKEQSEWLIEMIDNGFTAPIPAHCKNDDAYSDGIMFTEHRIKGLIKQCTEQGFPEFAITDADDTKISLTLEQDMLEIDMRGDTGAVMMYLGKKEFKQFADGVNAIKEWIEKDED